MEFKFEEWCEKYELNEETVNSLKERGFMTKLSLSVMCIEEIRKDFKKLMPAQVLLLEKAMKDFHSMYDQPPRDMPTSAAAAAADTVSVEQVLRQCGLQQDNKLEGMAPDADYQAVDPYGFGNGPHASKFRDITKFVTGAGTNVDSSGEEALVIGGKKYTTNERKITLDRLSNVQYAESSLSVLREMIVEEKMTPARILDHINYLIQISRFAQSFPWQSVLRYDGIYRRQQSELGFRWGTGSPILMQTQLSVTPRITPARKPQQKDNKGRIICQMWNGVSGCTFHNCKFAHVCRECFSPDHPHYQHNEKN